MPSGFIARLTSSGVRVALGHSNVTYEESKAAFAEGLSASDLCDNYLEGVDLEALACHRTQFTPAGASAANTRLTSPLFNQLIESRDAQFGAQAGVTWAEGVVVKEPVVRPTLLK